LTTVELQYALALEVEDYELDLDKIERFKGVVSVCAGLVTVNEEGDIVQLVHYTTQEYFEQTTEKWFPNAQYHITTACITYLSFSAFEGGARWSPWLFARRLESNKLYDYTAHHWGHHARQASTLHPKVLDFLQCTAKVESAAQEMLDRTPYFRHSDQGPVPGQMTGLHLAAYFWITESVAVNPSKYRCQVEGWLRLNAAIVGRRERARSCR
jgi:hypothetical protein